MYCKACSRQIDDDSKFCSHCGKKQFNDQNNKKVIKKTLDYNDLVYDYKEELYYHKGKRFTGKAKNYGNNIIQKGMNSIQMNIPNLVKV